MTDTLYDGHPVYWDLSEGGSAWGPTCTLFPQSQERDDRKAVGLREAGMGEGMDGIVLTGVGT